MRILTTLLALWLALPHVVWSLESISIGVCLPLSGHGAARGHDLLLGIKIAQRMRPEVVGRFVELNVVNTHSGVSDEAAAVNALLEKRSVAAVISGLSGEHAHVAYVSAEKRGVPVLAPFVTGAFMSMGRQYVFRTCSIDNDHAAMAANVARSRLKALTAAVVCDTSQESSLSMAAQFRTSFQQEQGKVIVEIRMNAGDRDFSPHIDKIVWTKPDVIYAPISCTECALFARQARLRGVTVPLLAAQAVQAPELLALGGAHVEGLVFTTHFQENLMDTARARRFSAACDFLIDRKPSLDQVMIAEAYFILLDAIEQAGSVLPISIREALASVEHFVGMTGKIAIRTDGKASRQVFLSSVKNGRFVPLARHTYAEAQ